MINPKNLTSDENPAYKYYNEQLASSFKYGRQVLDALFYRDKYTNVVQQQIIYPYSSKKIETLRKISELQMYYQRNPVRFIKDFFNIQLLDFQKYVITSSWICPNVLLLCSRGAGKSTISDLLIMSKQMLTGSAWSAYIASGSGSQAEQTFTTLEKIANDRIDSMVGSTCSSMFLPEVEIKNAAGNGFSHGSDGFTYSLYNGSFVKTLNSNVDRKRGARSNMVLFDECAFLSNELLEVFKAFTVVDKNFKTGSINGKSIDQVRLKAIPDEPGNQLIYISSASSVDMPFYKIFRDFSKRMLMGDKRYFVACIDCDQLTAPMMNGKPVAPLLNPQTINEAMRTNPEKARREYYCQFTIDAGDNAIIKRGVIARNEETRKPLLYNDTGDKKFVIAYDPARSRDNSVILVGEIYDAPMVNGDTEKKMRLVNCINLVDVGKKIKSPMQTPDQIEYLKKVILAYNGGADAYGNIIGIYIDAGSGGGGVNIADYLMPDWKSPDGTIHRGLIDKEYSAEYVKKFPNAVDKVRLISPSQYKSEMFEAMIELMNQNKISFTAEYDNKDYLTVFDINEEESKKKKQKIIEALKKEKLDEKQFQERLRSQYYSELQTKVIKLDWEDKIALANMDALKEELVNMQRRKRENGKDSFDLIPEKANKLHDDRAYTASLCSFALMRERRKVIISKHENKAQDYKTAFKIRAPKLITS